MCFFNEAAYVFVFIVEDYRMFESKGSNAPVVEGQTYDVKIEDTAKKGDGIARIEGFVIFVPGSKVGDNVKILVETVKRNFAVAKIVS
jgi:predicted RNA-binding protein with TRAM domain